MNSASSSAPSVRAFSNARLRGHGILQLCWAVAISFVIAAATLCHAANITLPGTGILGIKTNIDGTLGTLRFNSGVAGNIIDTNANTRVDNFLGADPQSVAFVGVIWPVKHYEAVTNISLTLATFIDGGWFGAPGAPAPTNGLAATNLIEPVVQVSTNFGTNWVTVGSTSDYQTVMLGHFVGGTGGQPNPTSKTSTFTLTTPATRINAIRIIGTNGGRAGADTNGFLGVFDLTVNAAAFVDGDTDGMADAWETEYGVTNPTADADNDGLTNLQEFLADSNPNIADTDADSLSDAYEVNVSRTNPRIADDNLALFGNGIIGIFDNVTNNIDVLFWQQQATPATLGNINDGNLTTRIDTFNGATLTSTSYVGIVWTNRPLATNQRVALLELTLALFGDGGWFGVNNIGPGAGGVLLSNTHLVTPLVQVTTNGGSNWITVPSTSTYLSALHGVHIGGGTYPNPQSATARFTLSTPATGINGVRIIGSEGGTASRGFIGVFEVAVRVDSDNDGIADGYERDNGLIVGTNDGADDPDFDGLTNLQEWGLGTRAQLFDSDGDGLTDADEVGTYLTNPNLADSDLDGLSDSVELNTAGTNPQAFDSDGDGLSDGVEVNTYRTNPLAVDSDGDGFTDAGEVAQGTDPNNRLNFPNNLASLSTASGILGTTNVTGDTYNYNAGTAANIRDNNLTTRVDNFTHPAANSNSFVGILWSQPITNVPIVSLELRLAVFLDGGWFGSNSFGPGAGGILSVSNSLVAPIVQVTTNGGTNWFNVGASNDYLAVMEGKRIGGGGQPNPTNYTIRFTLAQPTTNVNGIRIVGPHGGTVATSGFLGVFELIARTFFADSDGDGMDDAFERLNGLNVGVNDSALDPDSDGLTNIQEYQRGTNPQSSDTDGDGLADGAEVNTHRTNPALSDSDGDGLTDGDEVNTLRTNPLLRDTDADGYADGVEIGQGSDPLVATSIPANLALSPTASGILGVATDTSAQGTLVFNAGSAANINDGLTNSRVDSYSTAAATNSFVGLLWTRPVTNLVKLEFYICTFFDGGWFGVNGIGPGSGGRLGPQYLLAPVVQVSTNGGTNWTTIPATTDYLTALNNHPLPAVDFGTPTLALVNFQLGTPQTNINGIRIIGSEGGTVTGGFLGVWELRALGNNPQQVTIGSVSNLVGGIFHFEFNSQAGFSHAVQFKDSVTNTTWQTETNIVGDGTRKQVNVNRPGTFRMFRVTTQ